MTLACRGRAARGRASKLLCIAALLLGACNTTARDEWVNALRDCHAESESRTGVDFDSGRKLGTAAEWIVPLQNAMHIGTCLRQRAALRDRTE
jgi:hypothetical protein